MDEQTKQALQELKETTDRFAANVDRWIAEGEANVREINALAAEIMEKAQDVTSVIIEAAWEASKCR